MGSAFAQVAGEVIDCAGGRSSFSASWIFTHADIIGVILLGVMVILVVWRALTRQAVTAGEAMIGVIGLVAIILPLLTQFNLEVLGVKASGAIRQNQCDVIADVATLKKQVAKIEEEIGDLDANLNAFAKFAPGEMAAAQPKDQQANDVVTLIYYLDANGVSRRVDALQAQAALQSIGFQSSLIATDFTEINRQPGKFVRMFFTEKGKDSAEKMSAPLEQLFGDAFLLIRPAAKIARGDIQIQIY